MIAPAAPLRSWDLLPCCRCAGAQRLRAGSNDRPSDFDGEMHFHTVKFDHIMVARGWACAPMVFPFNRRKAGALNVRQEVNRSASWRSLPPASQACQAWSSSLVSNSCRPALAPLSNWMPRQKGPRWPLRQPTCALLQRPWDRPEWLQSGAARTETTCFCRSLPYRPGLPRGEVFHLVLAQFDHITVLEEMLLDRLAVDQRTVGTGSGPRGRNH